MILTQPLTLSTIINTLKELMAPSIPVVITNVIVFFTHLHEIFFYNSKWLLFFYRLRPD